MSNVKISVCMSNKCQPDTKLATFKSVFTDTHIVISVQWQSPSVNLPYEQWQLIISQRSYTFNFIVISFLNEAKHSIKNAFKLINQPPTHLQASYCCYISNVLNETTIQLSLRRISGSDLAKAQMKYFSSFHSEMNYNKQFVISNQPRERLMSRFHCWKFQTFFPKNLCLLNIFVCLSFPRNKEWSLTINLKKTHERQKSSWAIICLIYLYLN